MSEYISTRDESGSVFSYSDVLLKGLADDRGLFVPTDLYPEVDDEMLQSLSGLPYVEQYTRIKNKFIGEDIEPATQARLAEQAYDPAHFDIEDGGIVTPVTRVTDNLYIQNLSQGPTAAFKDMALRPLAQEMDHVLTERDELLVLLGATSGDTGSAAEAAVKGLGRLTLFMLSPEEGMSDFQAAQMGALSGDNIFNLSIPGDFTDCQDIVKDLNAQMPGLGAVNSINWGRISSQVPYYFSGYLQVVGDEIGKPVDVVVPTGNFGNILSAYIASEMGLPIRKMYAATNENDPVHRLIQTGEYVKPPSTVKTSSPSMDIQVASNYERLAFDLFDADPAKLHDYMHEFEETGRVSLANHGLSEDELLQAGFDSGVSTAEDRIDSIRWVRKQRGNSIIDPHTADAVTVARKKYEPGVPMLVMSTAQPVKFEKTIREAVGFAPLRSPRFARLEACSSGGFDKVAKDASAVRAYMEDVLVSHVS